MAEPNSFANPEFLKDLEFITNALSVTESAADASEVASSARESEDRESHLPDREPLQLHLNRILEQACIVTGATGAAIALGRGDEIVCRAATGPDAPGVGVCLDPLQGLSGSCMQTRQPQLCSDTETDPRVDTAACRELGVQSIIVLPLLDGDELIGIFEVLSSRPNAFSQRDMDNLQSLADRILQNTTQSGKSGVAVPGAASATLLPESEEFVHAVKDTSSESGSRSPRRERASRRNDIWTLILGALVIGASIVLGTVIGWRLGWQKATLGVRGNSPPHRIVEPEKSEQTDHGVSPALEPQSSSVSEDKCGQVSATGTQARQHADGLTVCKEGRVVFRLQPPATPTTTRPSRPSQQSTGSDSDPTKQQQY